MRKKGESGRSGRQGIRRECRFRVVARRDWTVILGKLGMGGHSEVTFLSLLQR